MKAALAWVGLALVIHLGCSEPGEFTKVSSRVAPSGSSPPPATPPEAGGPQLAPESKADTSRVPALPRKILYRALIEVTVDRFSDAEREVARLVKEQGGYIAESDVSGSPGAARSGRWVVRIPVERLDTFEEAVIRLGELLKRHRDSQDVTEEFYDVEARIKNKKIEESRLLKLLEESTATLKDTIEVERELSRVRGEIEQMQGRLQLLANLTSLTTVTITISEQFRYLPREAPTFVARIGRTFRASVQSLTEVLESLALMVVAVIPWIPLLSPIALVAWLIARRRRPRAPAAR